MPAGYNALRKDRIGRGGGVCIIYKKSLRVFRMPDVSNVECIFSKAYCGRIRYIIGVMYRPPSSSLSVFDDLKVYMNTYIKPGDRIIIAGDFNLPNIDWSAMSLVNHNDKTGDAMLDIAFAFDLSQVVGEYTRIHESSKSILDLFFVSGSISNKSECEIVTGISDHQAVLLTLYDTAIDKNRKHSCFPNFSHADDTSIIDVLSFHFDSFLM